MGGRDNERGWRGRRGMMQVTHSLTHSLAHSLTSHSNNFAPNLCAASAMACVAAPAHTQTHSNTYTHILHACIHTRTEAYVHTYMHTYTETHTQRNTHIHHLTLAPTRVDVSALWGVHGTDDTESDVTTNIQGGGTTKILTKSSLSHSLTTLTDCA